MITIALTYKAANSKDLKGKDDSLLVAQGGLGNENPFSGLTPMMLCP